jgi:hypothetical protein
LARETPEPALKALLGGRGRKRTGAAGDVVGETDRRPRVANQQVERTAADRLRQRLGPKVRRPDRVRLGDDVRAAILVAGDGQGQAEREQEPDKAEERALQNPERLLEVI